MRLTIPLWDLVEEVEEMERLVEGGAAILLHQLRLGHEAWTRQHHQQSRYLQITTEHHLPARLRLLLRLLLMDPLLIKLAFIQADFATFSHQTCR